MRLKHALLALPLFLSACYPMRNEVRMSREAKRLIREHPEADRRIVSTEGLLHYVQTGMDSGPLILFIHGTPGDWMGWIDYLKSIPLASRATLIAVDRPGMGQSEPTGPVDALDRQAAALEPLIQGHHGKVILVGHSYGAPVALQLALDHPDEVGALLFIGGSIDPSQEETLFIQRVGRQSWLRWLVPRALDNCNFEVLALKKDLLAQQPRLKSLRLPIVVMQGLDDPLVPKENADYAEAQLTNAKLNVIRIPKMDHFILWRDPERVEKVLVGLLDELKK